MIRIRQLVLGVFLLLIILGTTPMILGQESDCKSTLSNSE